MRIALISEHASPLAAVGEVDAGGQNIHVSGLAGALADGGHEITVYTRKDSAELPSRLRLRSGVTVEHVPAGPAAPLPKDELLPHMPSFGRYLAGRWQRQAPDVVHAHFWMSGLAALAGARGIGVPVVQTFHALGVVKQRHQGPADTSPADRIEAETAIAREVDMVIATCADEVAELAALGVPRRRIGVVPCGVDIDRFTPDGPVAARARGPRLLAVARLVERKGLETAVAALPDVPETELVIAGGPPRDQLRHVAEYRRLMRLARAHGVADRVRFAGRVPREHMPALMRSADLLVSVPWYEPFGMTPLEAMACGVPVVAAAVGGQTDTVVDGVTGVLVPPKQPRVLAGRIRELLADPTLRESLGIAGSQRARARYSWLRIGQQTAAMYERARRCRADPRRAAPGRADQRQVAAARQATGVGR